MDEIALLVPRLAMTEGFDVRGLFILDEMEKELPSRRPRLDPADLTAVIIPPRDGPRSALIVCSAQTINKLLLQLTILFIYWFLN